MQASGEQLLDIFAWQSSIVHGNKVGHEHIPYLVESRIIIEHEELEEDIHGFP
jgi:hypothetical protein